jgi:hypothetical protein
MLQHGTQNLPKGHADSGIMFGNCYFVEALGRYERAVVPPLHSWWADPRLVRDQDQRECSSHVRVMKEHGVGALAVLVQQPRLVVRCATRLARWWRKGLWLPKGSIMLERLRMWYWQTLQQTIVNCCFKVTEVWAEAHGTTQDSGRTSRDKPDTQTGDEDDR